MSKGSLRVPLALAQGMNVIPSFNNFSPRAFFSKQMYSLVTFARINRIYQRYKFVLGPNYFHL